MCIQFPASELALSSATEEELRDYARSMDLWAEGSDDGEGDSYYYESFKASEELGARINNPR